ncbi:cation diffusion facilitator family transporter [Stigmatella aurantiaca]|uniref:Cation diffusion facilitator family transporter n=1 Tax=Stigmatella aurantiaca TaxID=41 RepID=A0A1H8D1U6_STIAU|nr:cation diffusion facilitator family transporter [Stigmatella aurantiaca]SEN00674.1 cation diffusion facilitator family transporter [Stigmatella aurantiaca]
MERNRKVRRVLAAMLAANWAVAVAKLAFGLLNRSASVTADGIHSFIDGSSNILGLVAMTAAARPADEDHPYGHGKFEAIASLGIGAMISIAMVELGRMAIDTLIHGRHPEVTPTMAVVMLLTLGVNLVVTRVERHYGHQLKSTLLLADANHTLSDVYVTLAVLLSLALVWLGYPSADGVIALVVMVFVARVAYDIIRQAVGILSDTARLDVTQVCELTLSVPGVRSCRDVRSRGMEDSVYVDLKIEVDPQLSTAQAHEVADRVEEKLHTAYSQVVDVVIHVEPAPARLSKASS